MYMHYRSFVLRLIPKSLWLVVREVYFRLRLLPSSVYDYRRFVSHSGVNKSKNSFNQIAARITLKYHQVEKGLSLKSPRPGFGVDAIKQLIDLLRFFISTHGLVAPATTAIAVLDSYIDFNQNAGCDVDWLVRELDALRTQYSVERAAEAKWTGGLVTFTRESLEVERSKGFPSFFQSRYSVRQFGGGDVPISVLKEVVRIAQKTPSVCNRQSWRAHVYRDQKIVAKLLEIQACSRGFGESASAVIVVTSELGAFIDASERYQPWIDGGMFAMSICLGLHYYGLGACCLNWSKEKGVDQHFRKVAEIPESENVIMLIAVGTLLDEFVVAASSRPSVESCMIVH